MNNQKTTRQLLLIYLLTVFGSNLTTIFSFLSLEYHFHDSNSISLSLSIRTIGFFIFSYITPTLLTLWGEKKTILFAQSFGIFAVALLWHGFNTNNIIIAYAGIFLTGLPGNITNTSLIAATRHLNSDNKTFRYYSSTREMTTGITLALAGIAAPLLIGRISIANVFLIDMLTYGLAVLLLTRITLPKHAPQDTGQLFPNIKDLSHPASLLFIATTLPCLVLMATLPLVSSSDLIRNSLGISSNLIFLSVWGAEGLITIFSSKIYPKIRTIRPLIFLLSVNSIFLILCIYSAAPAVKILSLLMISASSSIIFFNNRDSLVIAAGRNTRSININASIGSLIRSIGGSISPILMMKSATYGLILWLALSLLATQILIGAVGLRNTTNDG